MRNRPPSIPDQIEHADADQNASGFNIPQAAKQPDGQAPVTQSKPGTESFTSVDPEPENTDERLTSQNEGYGKVSANRPKPRVAQAPFDVSFDTIPSRHYDVQVLADLPAGGWSNAYENIAGDGTEMQRTIGNSGAGQNIRVLVKP